MNFSAIESFVTKHRRLFIIVIQTLLVPLSYFASFLLRFDFAIYQDLVIDPFYKTVVLLIIARLVLFYYFDLFSGWWRYVGIEDIIKIGSAVLASSVIFIASVVFVFGLERFPRSVFLIDTILIFMLLSGVRVFTKLISEKLGRLRVRGHASNVLIVGAGNTGVTVLNEIRTSPELQLRTVGFVDNDPSKQGFRIRNVEVLGRAQDLPELIRRHNVKQVLIALPSAPYKEVHEICELCDGAGVPYKALPGMSKILAGKTIVSQMRDVRPDELLRRPAVSFEDERSNLRQELAQKCIMVTGAGGSIGSELCRQIAAFGPSCLVMYERGENNLYEIDMEMRRKHPALAVASIIGDILNREKLEQVLQTYKPYIVYHAAAYKHVPLMEREPLEAVRNNFLGTKVLSEQCVRHAIEKFVFISTDKAVNPSSIMGTTKRMTEKLLQTYGQQPTRFISVRFGNVIGSSGSVIPLRGTDAIMWTVKFRNGILKRYKFPIRTTSEGSIDLYSGKPEQDYANLKKPGFFNMTEYPTL